VARAVGHDAPDHAPVEEVQIPKQIKDLVPRELALELRGRRVVVVVDDYGVLLAAGGQPGCLPQCARLSLQNERPGRRDLSRKHFSGISGQPHGHTLLTDHGMRVIEVVADLAPAATGAGESLQRPALTLHDDGRLDDERQDAFTQFPNPCLADHLAEPRGAAVEGRNLRAVRHHAQVRDPERREGRHEVLDEVYLRAVVPGLCKGDACVAQSRCGAGREAERRAVLHLQRKCTQTR